MSETGRPATPLFDTVAFIGIGHIASSLALALRRHGLVRRMVATARHQETLDVALRLGTVDEATTDIGKAVAEADLVMICVPVGACGQVAAAAAPFLKPGAIVSDVGSVKRAVIRDVVPALPAGTPFVPGHPLAGTEFSGPESGVVDLFENRWVVLTPLAETPKPATDRVAAMWRAVGASVDLMDPGHHDQTLAITSHLPHLIAYTIVGTAADLATDLKQEVIKYSASGFRDFTRIAASDPVMWRDIFLNNREAVLSTLQRFTEDLTAMQRAIRKGEGDFLEKSFVRTRAIRRGIIDARQA